MDFENKTLLKLNDDLAHNAETSSTLHQEIIKALEQAKREWKATVASLNRYYAVRRFA